MKIIRRFEWTNEQYDLTKRHINFLSFLLHVHSVVVCDSFVFEAHDCEFIATKIPHRQIMHHGITNEYVFDKSKKKKNMDEIKAKISISIKSIFLLLLFVMVGFFMAFMMHCWPWFYIPSRFSHSNRHNTWYRASWSVCCMLCALVHCTLFTIRL